MKKLLLMIGLFGILVGCQNDEGGNDGLKPRKDINLSVSAVSYTHLTLPTTPYV